VTIIDLRVLRLIYCCAGISQLIIVPVSVNLCYF